MLDSAWYSLQCSASLVTAQTQSAAPDQPALAEIGAADLVFVALAMLAVVVMWRRGVLSSSAFATAPQRRGSLGLYDPLWALGGLLVIGGLAAAVAIAAFGQASEAERLLAAMLGAQLGALVIVPAILIRAAVACEGGLRGFGLRFDRPLPTLGAAVLAALVLIVLTIATIGLAVMISMLLGYERPDPIAHPTLQALLETRDVAVRAVLIISAAVVAPITEELIFRGMVQTAILQSGLLGGRWRAILITSALFTVMHLSLAWQTLPGLFVLSVGLGYVYERTGRIWAPILIHAIFNSFQLGLLLSGVVQPN